MQKTTKTKSKFVKIIVPIIAIIFGIGIFSIVYQYLSLPQFAVPILSEVKLAQKGQTIIVFSPHCDDEVLGPGGLIAKSIQNGAKVYVVLMTNGDGQRFGTIEEFRKIYPNANNYIKSGYDRQQETISALSVLGVPKENIIFLGYPDHGLKKLLTINWSTPYRSPYTRTSQSPYNNSYQKDASYTGTNVENNIEEILKTYSPNLIIATPKFDQHPDHAATFEFVVRAMQTDQINTQFWTYLVHYKNFPNPSGLKKDKYLSPPAALFDFSDNWQILSLDQQTEDLKQTAIQQYQSQLKVPFLNNLLISFIRKNELFNIVY
jgi:LmbE family N-acetylglucosaminyl deacetylase